MTNLKLSSKMHIFIIISAAIIAIGVAVGLICQFAANGYFNRGAEYESYQSVVVDYAFVDYNADDKVVELCDAAFKAEGVSYYLKSVGETDEGGEIIFRFSKGTQTEKIAAAVAAINSAFPDYEGIQLTNAYLHTVTTELGGAQVMKYAAIALSAAVAFQFLYYVVRYGLMCGASAFLANVHNLALFVSLVTITRIPVGSAAFVFGVICVLLTMIGCSLVFGKLRSSLKDEAFGKLSHAEQVDATAADSLCTVATVSVFVCAAAAILLVLLAISALSLHVIITPVILAIFCALSSVYGTLFFVPSVHSRLKKIGEDFKAKRKAKKSASKADKKS